jgi:3-hydroxyacyl-[acyl-carrier-protein] dehydratase
LRFELIDRVLEHGPDRLVAVKNVSAAEEYLGDHFPGFPVLPGVMMLEALVQAGRRLVELLPRDDAGAAAGSQGDSPGAPLVVADVRNLRYAAMVRPGQSLRVEVTLRGRDERGWDFAGTGTVEDQVAVQGRFRLAPLAVPGGREGGSGSPA